MLLGEIVAVALRALRANTLRSLLTMLGIVIGVAAVIAMLALGAGARHAIQSRISALGTTRLSVHATRVRQGGVERQDTHRLRMEDVQFLRTRGHLITMIQPQQDRNLQVEYHGANTYTQITGTTPNILQVKQFAIGAGRMFTEQDDRARRRYAVLGTTVVQNLGFAHPADALGRQIRIRGISFDVIGVLQSKGQAAGGFNDPDDQVMIPLETGRFIVFDSPNLNDINVLAPSEAAIPLTMVELQRIMRRAHRLRPGDVDDFRIRGQSDFLNALNQTTQIFGLLLAAIASVSLLVGGVGIMNIMLVSVTERTREIGIRKALGATRWHILLQFLIEAVTLCALGGLIGVAVGVFSATTLRSLMSWNTRVAPASIIAAFLFAALIGVVFGVWPARRAARLDPIEALRYE